MSVMATMRARGGVISANALHAAGFTDRQVGAVLDSGQLIRIRTGWYRIAGAPEPVVRAVSAGGVLTCVSALAAQGVWTMRDPRVHVRIGRGGFAHAGEHVRVHWSDRRHDHHFPMDSAVDALAIAIRCLDLRAAVVALDSARNLGVVTPDQTVAVCSTPRGRRLLALSDPTSQSGIETIARLALRRLHLRVQTQVSVESVGTVDLLIGDRLVLEVDGEAWHDRPGDFERDRTRDRELAARGYIVLRASYSQVMMQWPEIEEQILRLVHRNAHRWPRHRD